MANKDLSSLEKRLWATAYELQAHSKFKSAEYSVPVLGLIFLWFWLHWQRRLVVRWEYYTKNSLVFIQLVSMCLLLTQVVR